MCVHGRMQVPFICCFWPWKTFQFDTVADMLAEANSDEQPHGLHASEQTDERQPVLSHWSHLQAMNNACPLTLRNECPTPAIGHQP